MSDDAQDGVSRRTMFKAGATAGAAAVVASTGAVAAPAAAATAAGRATRPAGTIEVGKLGDLVVLNRNYFTIPEADLRQVRSVLTVLGGRVVHT